ncbi:MAG: MSMEG_0567/Sll0786 family nitrogen starvation N-acetyltransferase [Planctomycetota bacterium]
MRPLIDTPTMPPTRREQGRVRFAVEPWEIEAARRIRRQVFVVEQKVFEQHDRDEIDETALTIIAIQPGPRALVSNPTITGTVRIHRDPDSSRWYGSRLAVLQDHRGSAAIAASLIRKAVASAIAIDCSSFQARIQLRNRRLFERLGWVVRRELMYEGKPHLFVEADLERFRPDDHLTPLEVRWAKHLGTEQRLMMQAANEPVDSDWILTGSAS